MKEEKLFPKFDFVKYSGKVPELDEIPNSTIIHLNIPQSHLVKDERGGLRGVVDKLSQKITGKARQKVEEISHEVTLVNLNIVNNGGKALFSFEPYFFYIKPQDNVYDLGDIVKDSSKIIGGEMRDKNVYSLGFIQTPVEIPNATHPRTSYYSKNRNNDLTVKLFGYQKKDKFAIIGYREYKKDGKPYSLVVCTIDRFPNDPVTSYVYPYNWEDLKGVEGFKMSRSGKRIFMVGKDENNKEFYKVLKLSASNRWMLNAPMSFIDRSRYHEKGKQNKK